jgi:hypothetical protein
MAEQARVTSLEALESFRSSLIIFISQARPLLDEVTAEIVRTRGWLETDQRTLWEGQLRRRSKHLQEAQQALFSARLGTLRQQTSMEFLMVQRAKAQVEEAEHKLRVLKKWNREYDRAVQPPVKQMEKLHTVLSNDLVKAVAFLTQAIASLAAYAETKKESNS